jgi:two-component system, NarL family, nitrate/nitrite response regulator NarL
VGNSISVLVIAHEAVIREAVRVLCERADDLSLAGSAPSVAEAIDQETHARVILLDVKGGDLEPHTVERLHDAHPGAHVVALVDRDELVRPALAHGAVAALTKSAPVHRIIRTIQLASKGQRVSSGDDLGPDPTLLSPRERQVLKLLSLGRTNRDIATALGISARTVGTHVGTIYRKLGVSDRVEAAHRGLEMGLDTENDDGQTTVRGDPPGGT